MLNRNETLGEDRKSGTPPAAKAAPLYNSVPVWGRGLIICAEIGLVSYLAVLAAGLVVTLISDTSEADLPVVVPLASNVADTNMGAYTLPDFDPFYRTTVKAGRAEAVAPESTMKIQLFGLRADNAGGGTAILKVGDEGQQLVKVGAEIKDGVSLAGVYSDRIEILRAGLRETVYMNPEAKRDASTGIAPRPAQTGQVMLGKLQGRNLQSLVMGLDLSPVMAGSRINGFMVGAGASAESIAAFGLMPEDVLLSINDTSLVSFERVAELAEELKGTSKLLLTYERRGEQRTQTLTVVW